MILFEFGLDQPGTWEERTRYGNILYQDQELNIFKQLSGEKQKEAKCMIPVIITIFLVIISFLTLENDCATFFVIFLIISIFIVIFFMFIYKPNTFTIYEHGIKFSTGSAPFVSFDDIVEFEERQMVGSGEPFIWLKLRSGSVHRIASVFNPSIPEKPQNYLEVLRILKAKLKAAKTTEQAEKTGDVLKPTMVDIYWTPEANLEFRKVVVDKDMLEQNVIEYIRTQGRSRVEMEDIKMVIENSNYLKISKKLVVKKRKRSGKRIRPPKKGAKTDITEPGRPERPPKYLEEI